MSACVSLYAEQIPTVFMTGCSNPKTCLSAESWVDDRLRPYKHISLKFPSHIFTVGLSARVRAER